ncbi:MAG TPA: glycolate oxidase subunit GlcE [Rhodospirillaceae bacterium]|nr:glycolate oxidase subunit GlcE [Rhodospirillaceae bacterium]
MLIDATDERMVAEAVAEAAAGGLGLAVEGNASKAALGRPMTTARRLRLGGLSGIVAYEPEELVLTARAGTPLAEIEAALAGRRQHLAFEPRDLGPLLGGAGLPQTLGGVVACGLAGPRRCVGGAVRDHVLGITAVNGLGELFKAGGKVVKNVTGYDLVKLLTGSFGTLAVFTEITVKVLPAPETEETVVFPGRDATAAVALMAGALGGPVEPSAAAWLDGGVCLRLDGFAASVAARRRRLFADCGEGELLEAAASRRLWQDIAGVAPFVGRPGRAVWRLTQRPSDAPALLRRLAMVEGAEAFLDWGGALAWLSLPTGDDGGAATVRQAVAAGGQAWLVAAPEAIRAVQPVFPPLPAPLAGLEARVKAAFDPRGILNPGRMRG